jgi:hypothetical protein
LEQTLEHEQEQQISKLMKKIERLEKETSTKQTTLEQVRGEGGGLGGREMEGERERWGEGEHCYFNS